MESTGIALRIEPLSEADLDTIRTWIDPTVFRMFKPPVDDAQLRGLLTEEQDGRVVRLGFKAVDAPNGSAVGYIHTVLDWTNNLAHIRQILVKPGPHRRRGVGTALMKHTLRLAFTELKVHRVQLFVDDWNVDAVAFYRSLGFTEEGLMREAWRVEGCYIGWHCMSILDREWFAQAAQSGVPIP